MMREQREDTYLDFRRRLRLIGKDLESYTLPQPCRRRADGTYYYHGKPKTPDKQAVQELLQDTQRRLDILKQELESATKIEIWDPTTETVGLNLGDCCFMVETKDCEEGNCIVKYGIVSTQGKVPPECSTNKVDASEVLAYGRHTEMLLKFLRWYDKGCPPAE